MRKNHSFIWINTTGKIVNNHVIDVISNVLGSVAIGNNLVIGNYNIGVNAHILQTNTLFKRSKVMPQMKPARWSIACKHSI